MEDARDAALDAEYQPLRRNNCHRLVREGFTSGRSAQVMSRYSIRHAGWK
jgi:hypothetical protein